MDEYNRIAPSPPRRLRPAPGRNAPRRGTGDKSTKVQFKLSDAEYQALMAHAAALRIHPCRLARMIIGKSVVRSMHSGEQGGGK
jgi:hypothetical protein